MTSDSLRRLRPPALGTRVDELLHHPLASKYPCTGQSGMGKGPIWGNFQAANKGSRCLTCLIPPTPSPPFPKNFKGLFWGLLSFSFLFFFEGSGGGWFLFSAAFFYREAAAVRVGTSKYRNAKNGQGPRRRDFINLVHTPKSKLDAQALLTEQVPVFQKKKELVYHTRTPFYLALISDHGLSRVPIVSRLLLLAFALSPEHLEHPFALRSHSKLPVPFHIFPFFTLLCLPST